MGFDDLYGDETTDVQKDLAVELLGQVVDLVNANPQIHAGVAALVLSTAAGRFLEMTKPVLHQPLAKLCDENLRRGLEDDTP